MSVPVKTFTGVAGQNLAGTNGAGTINSGGLQRDLTTLFAMFNPEAVRSDGATGGIKLENLAVGFWAALAAANIAKAGELGTVKVPTEFIDYSTGLLKFGGITKAFADTKWLSLAGNATTISNQVIYNWTFATALSDIDPPYFVQVWFANDGNGSGMWQFNGCFAHHDGSNGVDAVALSPVSSMTKTSCVLLLASSGDGDYRRVWSPYGNYFRAIAYKICD